MYKSVCNQFRRWENSRKWWLARKWVCKAVNFFFPKWMISQISLSFLCKRYFSISSLLYWASLPLGGTLSKLSFFQCPEDKQTLWIFIIFSVFVFKLKVFVLVLCWQWRWFFVIKIWKTKHFQMFWLVPTSSTYSLVERFNLLEKHSLLSHVH